MTDLHEYLNSITSLSKETWHEVKLLFTETKLQKGDFFSVEGEIAKKIGFLSQGILRAFYRGSGGIEYNKHFFTAPCMAGAYSSLITSKPNLINQQALSDCTLWVADYKALCKLYDVHADLERIGRKLAELYFVNKEQREIEIVLLDASKRYQIFQEQYPGLEQLIPQYHIASYLGISPTQLSRIRNKRAKK